MKVKKEEDTEDADDEGKSYLSGILRSTYTRLPRDSLGGSLVNEKTGCRGLVQLGTTLVQLGPAREPSDRGMSPDLFGNSCPTTDLVIPVRDASRSDYASFEPAAMLDSKSDERV